MFFVSVRTRENFSPARNVRSTTAPESSAFSFVRTNAPPLPGFTCWKSTMRQTSPSSSMCMPFLNWFVLTVSAIAGRRLADLDQVLADAGQVLDRSIADDDVVFDPDPADTLEVDARLDSYDVSGAERVGRFLRHPRRFVHLEPEPVPEAVAERPLEPSGIDDSASDAVGLDSAQPGTDAVECSRLRVETYRVCLFQLVRKRPRRERARVVGAIAVDRTARVDHHGLTPADRAVGRTAMRLRGVRAGRHDRLECRGGALVVAQLVERPRDVPFGPADERLVRKPLVDPIRDRAGAADRVELL